MIMFNYEDNDFSKKDPQLWKALQQEADRQEHNIELIASENFVSRAVMEAQGSIATNKYAEGYPGKRYYGGCEHVDTIENLAIERAKKLFNAKFANVQPHSGSQANTAAYMALVKPGDRVMGMNLSSGGHLTHGSPVNFSGLTYEFFPYNVDRETEYIDYEALRTQALEIQPKLIVAGASAYSRIIDFKKFREIADEVGAYLVVDMAHIAGLIAAGLHPNPIEFAHIVTSTTHKTLRGPRGGLILTNDEGLAKKINSAIFPGIQGGPLEHVIAAKAVAFFEALQPEFTDYQTQVIKNTAAMAAIFNQAENLRVVSGGSDNHLLMLEVSQLGITGKDAEHILDAVGITVNKNTIPYETLSPFKTSGIRIGSPAATTRGFKETEMEEVARLIIKALTNHEDENVLDEIKKEVRKLTDAFPLYQ